MEAQYHQFESPENSSVRAEHRGSPQTGMRRNVVYVLYGVLLLLLLLLLLVTGIKFSQLNNEISDVKVHLQRMSHRGDAASSSTAAPPIYLKPLVPAKGKCKEGWVNFQSSCYLVSNSATTWSHAEDSCKTHSAHLLVVNNVEELDYISKIVEVRYNYWIGLVERHNEGHWTWVDGTDFNSTPTFWDVGQPDDWDYRENGEDCGQIHGYEVRQRKLWNDADCNLHYGYICETRV